MDNLSAGLSARVDRTDDKVRVTVLSSCGRGILRLSKG